MNKTAQTIVSGLLFVMFAVVIFVKAGQKSGESGGTQAASIISATSNGFSNVISSATGGA